MTAQQLNDAKDTDNSNLARISDETAAAPVPNPAIKWGQDKFHVYITIGTTGISNDHATSKCELTANACNSASRDDPTSSDTITIQTPPQTGQMLFILYDMFNVSSSLVITKPDGETFITLSKQKPGTWPRLTKSAEKHHFVSIDWSHWNEEDSDEEDGAQLHSNVMDYGLAGLLPITPEDCEIKDAPVPALDLSMLDSNTNAAVSKYWAEILTCPQRLHTLVRLWNKTTQTDRMALLRTLISLMPSTLAENVKGGNQVLSDLNASEYVAQKVAYVEQWENDFEQLPADSNTTIITHLFSLLPESEQKIVCSTFV